MRTFVQRLAAGAAATAVVVGGLGLAAAPQADAAPGDIVLDENFDSYSSVADLPEHWQAHSGDWQIKDGELVVKAGGINRLTFGENLPENYRIEANIRFESVANSARWTAIALDIPADGSEPWWQAAFRSNTTAGNGVEFANRTIGGWNVPYTAPAPTAMNTGVDAKVAIEVQGSKTKMYFNDELVLRGTIARTDEGVLGLVADNATVAFDDIVVTEIEPANLILDEGELPVTIAHRGYSSILPENTVLSEVAAMKVGAEYFEIDLYVNNNNVPVVIHDGTVNRTTDGSGPVATLTLEALGPLDAGSWKDPAYAGEKVPTLQDILDSMENNQGTLMLEVKSLRSRDDMWMAIDMVRDAGLLDRLAVESFNSTYVQWANEYNQEHSTEIPLGLLAGAAHADPVAAAQAVGATMYNPGAGAVTPELVDELHEAGIAVMPYTINSPAEWQRLKEAGVDGIVTDRPGAYIGWKEAHDTIVAPAPEPETPAPTVALVGVAEGDDLERGEQLIVAAASTDADEVTYTLDGAAIEAGTVPVRELSLGDHVLTVTADGAGGSVTETVNFRVIATLDGVKQQVLTADLPMGLETLIMVALDLEQWNWASALVSRSVPQNAGRQALLDEIVFLAAN